MKFGTETKQQRIDRLEAERVQKSNHQREIARVRGYVSELDLQLHQRQERVAELRSEAQRIEADLPKRERKLAQERARLAQMESAA